MGSDLSILSSNDWKRLSDGRTGKIYFYNAEFKAVSQNKPSSSKVPWYKFIRKNPVSNWKGNGICMIYL
jgi:hypothetical protein